MVEKSFNSWRGREGSVVRQVSKRVKAKGQAPQGPRVGQGQCREESGSDGEDSECLVTRLLPADSGGHHRSLCPSLVTF